MNPLNLTILPNDTWILRGVAFLVLSLGFSCNRPESLFIGPYELPFQEVADAQEKLSSAFTLEGDDILRAHLMLFGLGEAAILHQRDPEKSASALLEAQKWSTRIQAEGAFLPVMEAWGLEIGAVIERDGAQLPHPSGLGASVAAAVATMENGEWAGPLATTYGWELILLDQRMPGVRNRAQVFLYRMQFAVGDDAARAQAKSDWATLPLRGNAELLQALPQSFRLDRIVPEPE